MSRKTLQAPFPASRSAPDAADTARARLPDLSGRLARGRLTRRDSLWLFAAATSGLGASGCAVSPVTGKMIPEGMSPAAERAADQQHAPHQFSADLGAVQDPAVNGYVAGVLQRMQPHAHRKDMPYTARVLNANYVNAYTFPAGSMGITRGIMVDMKDEAQLAALLGHEMGHVNARHTTQRQGQALFATLALTAVAVAMGDNRWSPLVGIGAQIGASALLARYSRDNEREADALGQRYMVAAGYPAQGMTQLHEMLLTEERAKPGVLETMFSSHPLSQERRDNAARQAETTYADTTGRPAGRERYMDSISSLRRIQPTIAACQAGETAMSRKQWTEAERHLANAIRMTPGDYAANLRMAQTQQAMGRLPEARRYAQAARDIYPQEAQAVKLGATLKLALRDPGGALADLNAFDRLLPGDPGTVFLKGTAYEAMGQQRPAAEHFAQFLRMGATGDAASYSQQRLKAWGYIR
ncbi:MAG: M48 family metalloprotease [Rubrivivax sp.]|nr:M48 family metalloprotease [Rubrivivax sp.]